MPSQTPDDPGFRWSGSLGEIGVRHVFARAAELGVSGKLRLEREGWASTVELVGGEVVAVSGADPFADGQWASGQFELVQRAPGLDGQLGAGVELAGTLAVARPRDLLRHCAEVRITGDLWLDSDAGERARVRFVAGRVDVAEVGGVPELGAIAKVERWTSGRWRLAVSPLLGGEAQPVFNEGDAAARRDLLAPLGASLDGSELLAPPPPAISPLAVLDSTDEVEIEGDDVPIALADAPSPRAGGGDGISETGGRAAPAEEPLKGVMGVEAEVRGATPIALERAPRITPRSEPREAVPSLRPQNSRIGWAVAAVIIGALGGGVAGWMHGRASARREAASDSIERAQPWPPPPSTAPPVTPPAPAVDQPVAAPHPSPARTVAALTSPMAPTAPTAPTSPTDGAPAAAATPTTPVPAKAARFVAKGRRFLVQGHPHTASDWFRLGERAAPDDVAIAHYLEMALGKTGRGDLVIDGGDVVICGEPVHGPARLRLPAGPYTVERAGVTKEIELPRGGIVHLGAP